MASTVFASHPTRRSSSSSRHTPASHGRGGAGNMGSFPNDDNSHSLTTPTIKSEVYTTGRGGSGNMARNDDDGEKARKAQDVDVNPHPSGPTAPAHVGRGGAANVFVPSQDEIEYSKYQQQQQRQRQQSVDQQHAEKDKKAQKPESKSSSAAGGEATTTTSVLGDEESDKRVLLEKHEDGNANGTGEKNNGIAKEDTEKEERKEKAAREKKERDPYQGLADRGKNWLFGKK